MIMESVTLWLLPRLSRINCARATSISTSLAAPILKSSFSFNLVTERQNASPRRRNHFWQTKANDFQGEVLLCGIYTPLESTHKPPQQELETTSRAQMHVQISLSLWLQTQNQAFDGQNAVFTATIVSPLASSFLKNSEQGISPLLTDTAAPIAIQHHFPFEPKPCNSSQHSATMLYPPTCIGRCPSLAIHASTASEQKHNNRNRLC